MENGIRPEDIITIISDEGDEFEFIIVDIIEYEELRYVLGFTVDDIYSKELMILEEDEFEGDIEFFEVTDEDIKEKIFKIFEERNFNQK